MYSFCDWITVRVPFSHDEGAFGDSILRLSPEGEMQWEKKLWQVVASEESYSASVSVRSLSWDDVLEPYYKGNSKDAERKAREKYGVDLNRRKKFCMVEISGNPTKYFQGHNVWGYGDWVAVVEEFILGVLHRAKFQVEPYLEKRIRTGDFYLSRFDLTTNLDLGSAEKKAVFLMAMQQQAESKRGKKHSENTTSAFGARGRLQVKFYDKLSEVIAHFPKTPNLNIQKSIGANAEAYRKEFAKQCKQYEELTTFLAGVMPELTGYVRLETTIGSKFLSEKKVSLFSEFQELVEDEVLFVRERLENLKFGAMAMDEKSVLNITRKLESLICEGVLVRGCMAAFQLWLAGKNVRQMLAHNTFYRHRKAILEHFPEVDISLPLPAEKEQKTEALGNVIKGSFSEPTKNYQAGIYVPGRKVLQLPVSK